MRKSIHGQCTNTTTTTEIKHDYLKIAHKLASEAFERDKRGGTAKVDRNRLRESGLLSLIIPQSLGGKGESWETVFRLTCELAKVDGSIAHLFGYHFYV